MENLPFNFLGLEDKYSNYKKTKFVILPIAYDATTSYQAGTRFGPEAIISASRFLELYDEELKNEAYKIGINTQPEMRPNLASPERMIGEIEKTGYKEYFGLEYFPLLESRESLEKTWEYLTKDKGTGQ